MIRPVSQKNLKKDSHREPFFNSFVFDSKCIMGYDDGSSLLYTMII